ncbi:hypothetical protein FACS189461_1910 [Spirochaetia bacterium]|nr:hypothetical protein FACS189461_1910 [Spirochaetia bacterium]
MKGKLVLFAAILLFSCTKNVSKENNIPVKIEENQIVGIIENNMVTDDLSFNLSNNDELLKIDINSETDSYTINIGDLVYLKVPVDNNIGYFDGEEYKYTQMVDNNGNNNFHIEWFNMEKHFDGADSNYTTERLPQILAYINGELDDGRSIFYYHVRRNKINGIKLVERVQFSFHEVENISFLRQIVFTNDKYFFILTIWYDEIREKILNEMPEYFETYNNTEIYGDAYQIVRWNSEKLGELYGCFNEYKSFPKPIEELFSKSDAIFNSLRINGKEQE